MMALRSFAALLCLAAFVAAQEPTTLLIRDVSLFDGTAFQEHRSVLVRDGRVVTIGDASLASDGAKELSVAGGVLLPGLVLADSVSIAAMQASERSVFPQVRAGDAYDAFARQRALFSGITTAWLSPGRERLVPGTGSAVSLGPVNAGGGVLTGISAVHAVLTPGAWNPPALYVPAVPPGPENRPQVERQLPRTRGGAAVALRELFDEARKHAGGAEGDWDEDDCGALTAMSGVIAGKVALRVRAHSEAEIRLAIELAADAGTGLVIEGGREAWKLATELARAKASVVLEQGTLPGSDPRQLRKLEERPNAAALLVQAGVPVALAVPEGGAESDLLWYAGQHVAADFDNTRVLRAVTSEAARVLGIDAGVIREGAVADLALYDRDPLLPAARPVAVVARGRLVHGGAETDSGMVALRGVKIMHGDGSSIDDGIVLVVDGKIAGVGKGVTIPPGAKIVDMPDAVVVPGFVDSGTQSGIRNLRDDEGEVEPAATLPALGLETQPSTLFDATQADVTAAARSGVTTLVLIPGGGRNISGTLSVVKAGDVKPSPVVLPVAGIVCDYRTIRWSLEEVDRLRKQIDGVKKYFEAFEKYDKDLAAWQEKNPAAAGATAIAHSVTPSVAPELREALGGFWRGQVWSGSLDGRRASAELRFEKRKEALTAIVKLEGKDPFEGSAKIVDGVLSIEGTLGTKKLVASGALLRSEWQGTATLEGEAAATFLLQRSTTPFVVAVAATPAKDGKEAAAAPAKESKAAAAPAKDGKEANAAAAPAATKPAEPKDKPKAPRKNPSMEPWKSVLAGEAPLYLSVASERMARGLIALLRDELDMRVVLLSSENLPALLPLLKEKGVAYAPSGAPVLQVEGKDWPAVVHVARAGIPVMMRGLGASGAGLYASAAHAVQQGMNADDALKMLTRWPAMVLGQQARFGAIQNGRDADLVILSGVPFAPATRILRVMVGGRFVDGGAR
ncbi:MAG: hypothetical protein EXS14_03910 [Planctomycetes bacterium]|nr:hypothetical protein [Planctomycetota bacterium]